MTCASDKVFFVDFYTDWCGPCKMISPTFQSLADKAPDGAEFYKLNIDNIPDVADELSVHSIPTFHVFKGRESLDVVRGADRVRLTALVENGLKLL
ncbi:thioredoxin-like protein [Lanmaoa asiatica]|nr:thioredoxin-like protein [Lanmaoa asiatica]